MSDLTAAPVMDVEMAARLDNALAKMVRWSRRQVTGPLHMGPGMLAALATVVDRGPIRLGDLAALEGVAPATLSRIVAALEVDGHLARDVDPEDRRSSFVRATDRGAEVVLDLRTRRGELLLERLGPRLGPAERAALLSLLEALESALVDPAP